MSYFVTLTKISSLILPVTSFTMDLYPTSQNDFLSPLGSLMRITQANSLLVLFI